MVTTRVRSAKTASKVKKDIEPAAIEVCSLAVKHRPDTLLGLVGQDHLVSQVKGMIKLRRASSAILISGDSGCGKTTLARIITRLVNCKDLDLETFTPCGECRPCLAGDSSPDYVEVNIGSNGGIDEIRSLCQASKSMPMLGSNRVIMLDEVHRLSAPAAAALLKNLEDSPKRTMWILATTNPEKLLDTIVSRCLKLNITTIEPTVISKQLRIIAKREGVDLKSIDGGAEIVKTITELSNGSMRQAISILESALFTIGSSEEVDAKAIMQTFLNTGEADLERLAATLLVAIFNCDLKGIIHVARTSANCRGVLQKLRWIVQYHLDNSVGIARYTPYGAKLFTKLARDKDVKINLTMLVKIQYLLVEIELLFNSISIDESVLFLSKIGEFSSANKGQ